MILQNADNWNTITEDNLWARRKDLIELLNSWQGELLGEKYQERYNELREDDISRGVLIQHQLYYPGPGPGPFDKNFLRKLQPQEVPEDKENCLCRLLVKVHGEEGCEGGALAAPVRSYIRVQLHPSMDGRREVRQVPSVLFSPKDLQS